MFFLCLPMEQFVFANRIIVTHLCLSNMKILIAIVDDGIVLATGSNVANTLIKENNQEKHDDKGQFCFMEGF